MNNSSFRTIWLIGILAILLVLLGIVYAAGGSLSFMPSAHACTTEAKICPDGSAVGRTGPNCEFAACPDIATSSDAGGNTGNPVGTGRSDETPVVRVVKIGETMSAFGTSVTPLAIISDSRCPADVQCIWAGTVEIRTRIASAMGTSELTLTLGTSVTTEAESITLTSVTPAKAASAQTNPSDYRFTIEIAKK